MITQSYSTTRLSTIRNDDWWTDVIKWVSVYALADREKRTSKWYGSVAKGAVLRIKYAKFRDSNNCDWCVNNLVRIRLSGGTEHDLGDDFCHSVVAFFIHAVDSSWKHSNLLDVLTYITNWNLWSIRNVIFVRNVFFFVARRIAYWEPNVLNLLH